MKHLLLKIFNALCIKVCNVSVRYYLNWYKNFTKWLSIWEVVPIFRKEITLGLTSHYRISIEVCSQLKKLQENPAVFRFGKRIKLCSKCFGFSKACKVFSQVFSSWTLKHMYRERICSLSLLTVLMIRKF